jgi:hypothetical protein
MFMANLYRAVSGNKKFMVIVFDTQTDKAVKIDFGDKNYEDFTQHRSLARKYAYLKRAFGIKDKFGRDTFNNPLSANFWSVNLLWNESTIEINDVKRKYGIQINDYRHIPYNS